MWMIALDLVQGLFQGGQGVLLLPPPPPGLMPWPGIDALAIGFPIFNMLLPPLGFASLP